MSTLTSLIVWLLTSLGGGEPCTSESELACSEIEETSSSSSSETVWLGFVDISNGF